MTTGTTEQENIFREFVVEKELYVDTYNWAHIVANYTQEHIIKQISDAIVLFEIKLPYREISSLDVENDYFALKKLNWQDLYKTDGAWLNKFEYKYKFIDEYVGISNVGNKASDYFHQVERWKCDATGYPSPQKTWKTEQYRLTLFKALFSLKVKEINPTILRNLISLRKYIAAQFRPSAAKAIYDCFQAETVLDFCMGWGDRILGAHASQYVKKYVGIDPNSDLFNGYQKQFDAYDKLGKPMDYTLIQGRAEDETIKLDDEFDLIFTSPPYFDKEKYDQSAFQSYKMYHGFESWMQNFLFKAIEVRSKNLKSGGHLVINISDIYTRKKLYKICDGMNDYIASTGKFEYVGAIGLRMPKRPMSISADTVGVYGEPIWVYRKL
jgi:16S rRNA G966 N2-methylase RsmD